MKRLSLLLVAAAAGAPALAQSTVTLFGVAEAQVGRWRNLIAAPVSASNPFGATLEGGSTTGLIPYGINASRIGIRGVEDLGGGLTASFVLENQLALDSGTTPARFFHRQANVGLNGAWGHVRLGRLYTAWNDVASSAAPGYGDTYDPYVRVWRVAGPVPLGSPTPRANGQITGLAGAVGVNNDLGHAQNWAHVRMDNSLRYDTPLWAGLRLSAQVGADEGGGGRSRQSFAALYESGPVRTGIGYYAQGTRSFYDRDLQQYVAGAGRRGTLQTLTFAFNYDFGVARVVSMAGQSRYDLFSLDKRVTSTEWSVGVVVPIKVWTLKFSVAGTDSEDLAGRDWGGAFEAHYNLSKRTVLYGAYSVSKYGELLAGQPNQRSSITALGLRHSF